MLAPADRLLPQIVAIIDGPASLVAALIAAMREQVARHDEAGPVSPQATRLMQHTLQQLDQQQARLARLQGLETVEAAELTACRDALGRLLVFIERARHRPGNDVFAAACDILQMDRFRPLGAGEMAAAIWVLSQAGRLAPVGFELLSARLELARSAEADEAGQRRLEARLRDLEDRLAQDPQVAEVHQHLRHGSGVEARQQATFWAEAAGRPTDGEVRRRLQRLRLEVARRLGAVGHLATHLASAGAPAAAQASREARALDGEVRRLQARLQQAMRLVEGAVALPSMGGERLALRRWERGGHQGQRGRRPGREVVMYHRATGAEVTSRELSQQVAAAQATLARATLSLLAGVDSTLQGVLVPPLGEAQVRRAVEPHLASLAALAGPGGLDAEGRDLRARATGLLRLVAFLHEEEAASPLLFDQVRLHEDRKLLCLWVLHETRALAAALPVAIARLRRRRRRAPGAVPAAAPPAGAPPPPAQATAAASMVAAWGGLELEDAGDVEAEGEEAGEVEAEDEEAERAAASGAPWSAAVARPRRHGGVGTAAALASAFYAGTFATPLASLLYHYRKHARAAGAAPAHVDPAGLTAYLAAAQAARARWPEAQRAGEGYVTANRVDPALPIRVIDCEEVYLAMTDEPVPRIVSFRDRRQVGRA